ncbi:MAG: hypothetical protein RIT45_1814 [Pseudomonadota bacterium]
MRGTRSSRRTRLGAVVLGSVWLAASGCGGDEVGADTADVGAAVDSAGGAPDGGEPGDTVAAGDHGSAETVDTAAPADIGTDGGDGPDPATAERPSQLVHSAPTGWGRPIDAWLAAAKAAGGGVSTRIHALFPDADGEIWVGYGVSEASGSKTEAPLLKLGPDGDGVVDAASHDSAILGFSLDGTTLWATGGRPLDSTKGSLYRRPLNVPWQRFESLSAARRLDRVVRVGAWLFVTGSARATGDQPKDHRFATIWRSDDGGNFFEIVHQHSDAGTGDVRYEHVFASDGGIVALGVRRDAKGAVLELPHVRIATDGKVAPLPPGDLLKTLRPVGSGPLAGGGVLLGGEDVLAPGKPVLLRVGDGAAESLNPEGAALVATFPERKSGETLLLERDASGAVRVRALKTDGTAVTLLAPTTLAAGAEATAVAWRAGALLIATDAADVLRTGAKFRSADGN